MFFWGIRRRHQIAGFVSEATQAGGALFRVSAGNLRYWLFWWGVICNGITMSTVRTLFAAAMAAILISHLPVLAGDTLVFDGGDGPGKGKHIVLLAGDEEYRSEEALPMLGRILSVRHGFKCTVLFSVDPETGVIDPVNQTNIPGMSVLGSADMVVMLWRFRELPDSEMRHFVDFLKEGKPVLGLRTSTHAFSYERNKQSVYADYDWRSKSWPGGFGQQVLGDTWINHHGDHGSESTRGVIESGKAGHPILRGVSDIWGATDVYGLAHLPAEAEVLVRGAVLAGMTPDSKPVEGRKNDPMVPIVWVKDYQVAGGKTGKAICSTFGSAVDFQCEDARRMVVNACYWALGLEGELPARANVNYVGKYEPTFFGFGKFRTGVKPLDWRLP